MFRRVAILGLPLVAVLALGACPAYDRYSPVVGQDGLVPPDQFATYGAEQAQAVAIGRAMAANHTDGTPEGLAREVDAGMQYANKLRDVRLVVPDTLGPRLTVTFASGWRAGIVPIADGKGADETPGLAALKK